MSNYESESRIAKICFKYQPSDAKATHSQTVSRDHLICDVKEANNSDSNNTHPVYFKGPVSVFVGSIPLRTLDSRI